MKTENKGRLKKKPLTRTQILNEKVVFVSSDERFSDSFKPPCTYYVINAMDEGVFFRTNSRKTAREWADTLYGKDFYSISKSMRASVS